MNTKELNRDTITNINVHRRNTSPQAYKRGSDNKVDSSYVTIKMQRQPKLTGNVNNNNNKNSKNINVNK